MPAISQSLPPAFPSRASFRSVQTQSSLDEPGRFIFTRHLWQRTMPDGLRSEQNVLNKSQFSFSHSARPDYSVFRQQMSIDPIRPQPRSPSLTDSSLPPAESPLDRPLSKRGLTASGREEVGVDEAYRDPLHSRSNGGNSSIQVCLCQREPKIPRPRNAFILYRQHHQARVVAQNPGLANPEISKIIGEQWQRQHDEVKKRWKALAEEEKLRHQQQYPAYRYQPRQKGRRDNPLSRSSSSAIERGKCAKCSSRGIVTPAAPYSVTNNDSSPLPPSPVSTSTPNARTLPIPKDSTLQSPSTRGAILPHSNGVMALESGKHESDGSSPVSPGAKRRRFVYEYPTTARIVPNRYGGAVAAGPATPFPFSQTSPSHPYSPALSHIRRESLPGLRGVINSSTPMGPPPRPGPGYQQHRLSQTRIGSDRSLTLPPLQTDTANLNSSTNAPSTGGSARTIEAWSFRSKIKVLGQIAPPALINETEPRGPLIAVEGDDATAVSQLSEWLCEELRKGGDVAVQRIAAPDLAWHNDWQKPMVQYHILASAWVDKSDEMIRSLRYDKLPNPTDTAMGDNARRYEPAHSMRDLEENHVADRLSPIERKGEGTTTVHETIKEHIGSSANERMEVDKTPTMIASPRAFTFERPKPVVIISNFSLRASNVFACRIPIASNETYGGNDHWSWVATQWRGVVGPDLTIYLRDSVAGELTKPVIEIPEEGNLFVVKRTRVEGDKFRLEVEPSTLRRLGFEVGEWVRAFGGAKRGSQ